MDKALKEKLLAAVNKIDRPGTFCVQGSVPAILPGLEVQTIGAIGLPLAARQAEELRAQCEQAAHGQGTETIINTSVRRVWRLTPDRFALTNPDWESFLKGIVAKVQEGLGLESQKLQAHLYDLLLYDAGSFFLPHKDGEKLDRMVATLVIVLPSAHEGGELVVRHEGHEEIVDFSGASKSLQIHYAAFYADCEHEIRPLRQNYRLCLVYNLTLAKGKKGLGAPTSAEHIDEIAGLLARWADEPTAQKLVVTLQHEYTEKGVGWDALKGADRAAADIIALAAQRAACHAYLGLLTLWEHGSAQSNGDDDYGYRRRRYHHDDEDTGPHEMDEVIESSLSMKHGSDRAGEPMPFDELDVSEDDLLDPEALQEVEPEEDFEGYTGNAGMTLDRWYRHGAIVLWSEKRHFDIVCDQNPQSGVELLKKRMAALRKAGDDDAPALKNSCMALARAILAHWPTRSYGYHQDKEPKPNALLGLLDDLDDRELIDIYLGELLQKDTMLEPGKALARVCGRYGCPTFAPQLTAIVKNTTAESMPRNARMLEQLASATPRQDDEWSRLCEEFAQELVMAVERIDLDESANKWGRSALDHKMILPPLVRALVMSNQQTLLSRLVTHALAHPQRYPLVDVHLAAIVSMKDWLQENVKKPVPGLTQWFGACRQQLETMTAAEPRKPTDARRPASAQCTCKLCAELNRFLADPVEKVHRFMTHQGDRSHLEEAIRRWKCDVDMQTEKTRPSHTLVCTKNTNSFRAALEKYHEDVKRLEAVRLVENLMQPRSVRR